MKLHHPSYIITAIALVMMIAGCGGSGSSPNPPNPPAISVAFSPQAPASMDAGSNASLTAVVSNDNANGGVKWTVSCGSSQCGSLSAASTSSGTATKFTAPPTVPSPATVTVTATSVSDSTKSASATITIAAPSAPISVTLNTPPATLGINASASLTATVSNDNANAGVSWSVACGSAQCGAFSPTTTPSGTPTTYTAPAAVPAPATVTVTATSVTDSTKSASASITITPPPPVLADGNYVFHVAGQDPNDNYYLAGAFTVQNGVITAGEQDMVDGGQNASDNISASGSSLSVVNGNIQIVLNTGDTGVGVNGVETFRGTVVSGVRVLISEFDTFATANGSIDQQTSTAAPAGGYAFNLVGLDGTANQNPFVFGGILNITGSSINTSNSIFDYNDSGSVGQGQLFTSGSVAAPDSFGRVVVTLTPSAASGIPYPLALAGYTVGTNQIQLVEFPTGNPNEDLGADLGGVALGQGSNTGQFNQASVAGSSYAFGVNGQDNNGTTPSSAVQIAGAFGLNANGTVAGDLSLNDLYYHFGSQITDGTYTVDPTGRVTINATVTSGKLPGNPTFAFQLYLDGNGNALVLGVDPSQFTAGLSFLQQAPSSDYEGNFGLNSYGFSSINNEPAWAAVGPVTVASDAFSGYTDYSIQTQQNATSAVTQGASLSGTENSSSGLFQFYGLAVTSNNGSYAPDPQQQSGFGYWPIDANRVIALELDGQQMGLIMLEAIQPN
jgi:hypothetical protein